MSKKPTQVDLEELQLKLLQRELMKQKKRHARVEARIEKSEERLRREQEQSYDLVTNVEWEIACLHLQQWQRTGKPDWRILLDSKSSGYYYKPFIELLKLLHPHFYIGGARYSTNQYCINFYLYNTVEPDGSMPDVDRMVEAMNQIIPYMQPATESDISIPDIVGFFVWHSATEDFHLELLIQPSSNRVFVIKQEYRRVVEMLEFPTLKDGLIHIKTHHSRSEDRDEYTVQDDKNLIEHQADISGASHA